MYKILTVILLVFIGVSSATRSFNTPSNNLQRLTSDNRDKNVGFDICSTCIDEAVTVLNVLLQAILDEGIYATCGDLCGIVANKTSPFLGKVCDIACDAAGALEFIHLIVKADLDPIWYCEMAKMCEINDHGDAKFTNFGVYPNTGPQGTQFEIDCSFKSLNGTGTSMLRFIMADSHNQTSDNDFLIDAKKPGTYTEKIGLITASAWNCDPVKGLCDDFPVGTYNVTVQFCNGECGSHHPHSSTYDIGKAQFTVTKKK
ncbi:unnamed protein product [Adineta steineri]|uniref:Countin-like protein n=1 Tax=Adineta steineri TaxID=433720 RepID=A0A819W5M3_9BILA|nr:unnamed protein product [Adineta steineri]